MNSFDRRYREDHAPMPPTTIPCSSPNSLQFKDGSAFIHRSECPMCLKLEEEKERFKGEAARASMEVKRLRAALERISNYNATERVSPVAIARDALEGRTS